MSLLVFNSNYITPSKKEGAYAKNWNENNK